MLSAPFLATQSIAFEEGTVTVHANAAAAVFGLSTSAAPKILFALRNAEADDPIVGSSTRQTTGASCFCMSKDDDGALIAIRPQKKNMNLFFVHPLIQPGRGCVKLEESLKRRIRPRLNHFSRPPGPWLGPSSSPTSMWLSPCLTMISLSPMD
jgi:hypothetical protein